MKKFASLLLLLISMNMMAQVEVTAFNAGMAEGVTYFLPDTRLEFTVRAQCVTSTPGEFARYADRFLRITDAITDESKEWSLTGVDVKSTGVPNEANAFTVSINDNVASNLRLTNDGIIQAVNRDVEPVDIPEKQQRKVKRVDPRVYFTEEILQSTSTAKMAELIAKEIYAIRESKLSITRGTADNMPKDGLSMQLVLDELDLQERTLTELFTGHVDTVSYECNIRFMPTVESDTARAVLFRFSRKMGILERDDLAGSPVYYDFDVKEKIEVPQVEETNKLLKLLKKGEVKKEGICYIVPRRAKLKIYSLGKIFFEDELPFAQFGTVEVLSKKLFGKNSNTKVLFDTATGGIISIDNK